MARRLYLDTARLGLMRPTASRVYHDFVRFASEEGLTLYWDDFLTSGVESWPASLRSRYPHLAVWKGIPHLKQSLKRLAGAAPDSHVLLANRSAMLMKLAARLLRDRCRTVLYTDLAWPGYLRILKRERKCDTCSLHRVRLRARILKRKLSSGEVIDRLAGKFVRHGCDGLFLPLVDHMGIRLPVRDIVREIRRRAELRFVVVDGAQTLGHLPLQLADEEYDFFVAGCHKWLGAYHPLGLGLFGNPATADFIRQTAEHLVAHRKIDDPLLRFGYELEGLHGSATARR